MRSRRDTKHSTDKLNNMPNKKLEMGDSLKEIQRRKRNTNECALKQKISRKLLIGCSESNIIEVKPQCSEDNDEGILSLFFFLSQFFLKEFSSD